MVMLVTQDYKIVEKKSTRILLKTLRECQQIHDCWSILSEGCQKEVNDSLDDEIAYKLHKCFDFYHRKYDVKIEEGYGEMKDIEINISNICEKVRSWENE